MPLRIRGGEIDDEFPVRKGGGGDTPYQVVTSGLWRTDVFGRVSEKNHYSMKGRCRYRRAPFPGFRFK